MIKEIFKQSYQEYIEYMSKNISDYWVSYSFFNRRLQFDSFLNAMNNDFNFEKLIAIETGASHNLRDGVFGLFLGIATAKTNGKMMSVDIQDELLIYSKKLFAEVIPNLNYETYKDDSINFLLNLTEVPNIVHLDSWDFDLLNPFPSALHGWREFMAVESKMLPGSIIIIDDNYRNGTFIDWFHPDGHMEVITNRYPMIGKGAHVYQYVLGGASNWKLIGSHYDEYNCIKIIIQKK
jgi:hypothetical protein